VIPNSLPLDPVLNHTNLQTVLFVILVAVEQTTQLLHSDGSTLLPPRQCSVRRKKSTLGIFSFHSVNRIRQLIKHVNQTIKHNTDILVRVFSNFNNPMCFYKPTSGHHQAGSSSKCTLITCNKQSDINLYVTRHFTLALWPLGSPKRCRTFLLRQQRRKRICTVVPQLPVCL
jgi:hypothetical protein